MNINLQFSFLVATGLFWCDGSQILKSLNQFFQTKYSKTMFRKQCKASPFYWKVFLKSKISLLTVSWCVIWSWNENDLLVRSRQSFHLAIKGRPRCPDQENTVFWFEQLEQLGNLFFQSFGIRLCGERKKQIGMINIRHYWPFYIMNIKL